MKRPPKRPRGVGPAIESDGKHVVYLQYTKARGLVYRVFPYAPSIDDPVMRRSIDIDTHADWRPVCSLDANWLHNNDAYKSIYTKLAPRIVRALEDLRVAGALLDE